MNNPSTIILGAGVTGLAAGLVSQFPVYEARDVAGGICSSYYRVPDSERRLIQSPSDGSAYRFEYGGGHWIFGGDPAVLRLIMDLIPVRTYTRKSAVYFAKKGLYVPYPIQYNLSHLGQEVAAKALSEMAASTGRPCLTMADWLYNCFGPTLCEIFFAPFHERYTAGLWRTIAPQDPYKSPVQLSTAIQGAFSKTPGVGYNVTFRYPVGGLNELVHQMADRCHICYGKRAVRIDTGSRRVYFEDGSEVSYDRIISTLPLNKVQEMAGVCLDEKPDPYTSVLVLNIGGIAGKRCPDYHWLYIPDSRTGFHRIGFYSNVDKSFVPNRSERHASIYVEFAYVGGTVPRDGEIKNLCRQTIDELVEWGFLKDVEVIDPTWIEVAYTWSWPNSKWRQTTLQELLGRDIFQIGRYGRWVFQGIADSIRDGLMIGGALSAAVR